MKHVSVVALLAILAFGGLSSGSRVIAAPQPPAVPAADGIAPEALEQIAALLAEKQARTPAEQKIDSQLIYEQKMERGQPIADGIWAIETDLPYAADGHLVVDLRARDGSGLASRLSTAGIEVESASADGSALRAHVNVADVEALARPGRDLHSAEAGGDSRSGDDEPHRSDGAGKPELGG